MQSKVGTNTGGFLVSRLGTNAKAFAAACEARKRKESSLFNLEGTDPGASDYGPVAQLARAYD